MRLYCATCRGYKLHEIVREIEDVVTVTCRACGSSFDTPTGSRAFRGEGRWVRYLAHEIGVLRRYDRCEIEERSIALELAARKALAGPLPDRVEAMLREALDEVAIVVAAREREADESAPTEAPVEAR